MEAEAKLALDARALLGEGAVWDAGRGCVWFVDIKQRAVWRYDPAGDAHHRWDAPAEIGWVLPASDGRLLAGMRTGLHAFDTQSGQFTLLGTVPGEPSGNRLNDACTDFAGRVWFGSMDDGEEALSGRFYRFDRGTIEAAGPSSICITNGPAVCSASRRIFFTDTAGQKIMVADLDASGDVGPARLFVDTARDFPGAHPDGPVIDSEGCLWTGMWQGWAVARYSPEGKLLETVRLPVSNVTKLAFGGDDLRTAYVTTARIGLDDAALASQPQAGGLFSFRSKVAGTAATRVELS